MNYFGETLPIVQIISVFLVLSLLFLWERAMNAYFLIRDNALKNLINTKRVKYDEITLLNMKQGDSGYHRYGLLLSVGIAFLIGVSVYMLGFGAVNSILTLLLAAGIRGTLDLYLNKKVGWGLWVLGKDNPLDKIFNWPVRFSILGGSILLLILNCYLFKL